MAAVRDALCNIQPLEIPRPQVSGLQFIPTRGRQGFYRSIRREGAQYGVKIRENGPRRTPLSDVDWSADSDNQPRDSGGDIGADELPNNEQGEQMKKVGANDAEQNKQTVGSVAQSSTNLQNKADSSQTPPNYPPPDYETNTAS
ncbi:hypothetical protein AB6A40_005892 [Gnathostoma spinigerum]|uniref:Uncharacterized protein n=1 Tax=Gnathostoma spinigerum TaxID=75299 RepID=A0ABD6EQA4_9BILA